MQILDAKIAQYIKQAINEISANSQGEVVCVIAKASANYKFFPLFIAAILALSLGLMFNFGAIFFAPLSLTSLIFNYAFIVFLFIILALIFMIPSISVVLTPKRVKKTCAMRLANEQFFNNKLHQVTKHAGILIFISFAEKYVEIISDESVNKIAEADLFHNIVLNLIKCIKQDKLGEGLLYNIPQIKNILVKHFPSKEKSKERIEPLVEILEINYLS